MKIQTGEPFLVPPRWLFCLVGTDEAGVRRADAEAHGWRNPVWHHPDGSFE